MSELRIELAKHYTPHAKQLALHRSDKRFVVVSAGIRGGKTLSATVELLRRIYRDLAAGRGKVPAGTGRRRQPRLLYWVVSPTAEMGVHVHRYIHQFCPPELIERTYEDAVWLKPGILIEFKTAERPERLVGASVNGILVDEACRCKPETWRGSLRGRLADTQGFAIFASSPLGGKANWLYQELVSQDGIDPHVAAFSWHTADNPFIPAEEIAHAKATQPPAWFRRDWLADWQSFGGAVYDNFTDDNIVNEAQFRLEYGIGQGNGPDVWRRIFRRVIVGVDWGFSAPGAMIAIGQLGDNDFVVLEESIAPGRAITGPGTTWVSEAHRLKAKYGVSLFACDPARSDAINDFQTNGISSVGAFNDIYLGIRRVAEALHSVNGRPGLRIFSSCQTLIGELRSYMWKATKDGGSFTETPADGQSDHGCITGDSQVLTASGLRPINELATEDSFEVMAVENGQLVKRTAYAFLTKKNATVIALRYGNAQLQCTADHPLWTQRGWVAAGELRSDDLIAYRDFGDEAGLQRPALLPERRVLHMLQPEVRDRASGPGSSPLARASLGSGERANARGMARPPQESQSVGQFASEPASDAARRAHAGTRRDERRDEGVACVAGGQGVALRARPTGVRRVADLDEAVRRMRQDVRNEDWPRGRSVLPLELQDEGVQPTQSGLLEQVPPPEAGRDADVDVRRVLRFVSVAIVENAGEVLREEVLHGGLQGPTCDVFNLYVDGPSHAFIANGAVVSNCDALRYGIAELRPYANSKKAPGFGGSNARPIG